MKQKLLMMLAALMLMGTSAMAQSETLKGDVNADGAVDVADIAAVIQIMKDNGDIETKYYWYLGTEKLTTDTEVESNGIQISNASEITNPFTLPSDEFVYLYYPKAFGKATLTSSGLPAAGKDVMELTGVSLTNYYGWRFPKGALGSIVDIKF